MPAFWTSATALTGLAVSLICLRGASSRGRYLPAVGDTGVAGALGLIAVLMTARPAASCVIAAFPVVYLAIADRLKRAILREPVSFADGTELIQIYIYPQFYVPFVGSLIVYGVTLALVTVVAVALALEAPAFHGAGRALLLLAGAAVCAGIAVAYSRIPSRVAGWLSGGALSGDLAIDTRRFGTLGAIVVHSFWARGARPALRRAAALHLPVVARHPRPPHVVLIQAESFIDPRRLGSDPDLVLPNLGRLRAAAVYAGLMSTPAWGGTTTRSEFLALTGLAPGQLGLDISNPYHAFARSRLDSLAWRLRGAGYRTVCIHPFSASFYRRDIVLPLLGFETFFDISHFHARGRRAGAVSDAELASRINALVAASEEPVFLFGITIANHGPWHGRDFDEELAAYAVCCRGTDALIGILQDAPWMRDPGAVLGFYGDHAPILPRVMPRPAFCDTRPDYAIVQTGRMPGPPQDIAVSDIPSLIIELLDRPDAHSQAPSCSVARTLEATAP